MPRKCCPWGGIQLTLAPRIFRGVLHGILKLNSGNFEIVTLVSFIYGMGEMGYSLNPFEEAGVMIREDLSSFSKAYYMSVLGGDGGIRYYVRNNNDQDGMNHPGEGAKGMQVPCWLKLKRVGNSFDSYFSLDGVNWTYSPDASRTIEMNPTCYVGIFCRGNANYVELFGWENPNNESIVSATAEFEATKIEEIANIYTVQYPIPGHFVNINTEESYLDISQVFGKLDTDEIIYEAKSSDLGICRSSIPDETDSILITPRGIGSATLTLTGDVSSFNLVNSFPVFVWDTPEGWLSHDLGIMKTAGFAMQEADLFTLGGSANVSSPNLSEGFQFMHKSLVGDAEISTKIGAGEFPSPGGLAGISFQADSVALDAAMARLVYTGEATVRFESRANKGAVLISHAETEMSAPFWIRMNKTGSLMSAYLSEDGVSWTAFGTVELDLPDEFEGGLICGSSDISNLSIINFEELTLVHSEPAVNNPVPEQRMAVGLTSEIDISGVFGHPDGILPEITLENSDPDVVTTSLNAELLLTLTAISPGEAMISLFTGDDELTTEFPVYVTEALESDWIFEDIGETIKEGYPAYLGDQSYSISTFGSGISGTSDHCSFLYKEKTGAQRIVASIGSIEDRGGASQAGIMFRESTDSGSLYILYTVTAYEGLKLQYRWDDNSTPVIEVSNPDIKLPCWIKLARNDFNYFAAAYSLDGESWIPHGEFSIPLDLSPTALVGLTATSGFNEGSSLFDNVYIQETTGIEDAEVSYPVKVDHYPNPVRESATLRINVSEQVDMQIILYNMAGMVVAELMNERLNPGLHHILLNTDELVSGNYYYRVVTQGYVITNKIVKIR